jgi:putative endonuclease
MSPLDKKRLGRLGETQALRFLKKRGYRILARNFTTRQGEIDIIAEDRGTIAFVEVKCRTSDRFGEPKESVNRRKQQRIVRAAQYYLRRQGAMPPPYRFDIVSIQLDADYNVKEIELLQAAF